MPLIELDGITFAYAPEEAPVFRALSLTVEAGECVALLGDNGAGKSTLFRILNGLSFPQAGVYRLGGVEIHANYLKSRRNSARFHQRIGYLFQNPEVMLFNATVFDEIAFGPRQMGLSEQTVTQRVQDCMALFDLEPLAEKAPYHLSGGQKKQVALAAVLSLNPEILMLDEPFAGLDKTTRQRLLTLLRELKAAGKTMLLATHEAAVWEELSDRAVILQKE